MRVAVIGAGIAGLACGRALAEAGETAVLFEKSRGPGGRTATRRKDGFVWDSGATGIAPRGRALESWMLERLPRDELVLIPKPVYLHHGLRVTPGDPKRAMNRYTYRSGISKLAKLLAEGLELRTETLVEEIRAHGSGYAIHGEEFDAVVLTPPVPQTSLLLWALGESRPIASARYRSCISVMLGYRTATVNPPYHALLDPEQRHPLTWLSIESVKSPERAPEGGTAFVAQLSREFSLLNWHRPDEELVEISAGYLERLYGKPFDKPDAFDVMRWKYSQPESVSTFEHANPEGSRLVVAGDGVSGSRIEDAFESGTRAARHLLGQPA